MSYTLDQKVSIIEIWQEHGLLALNEPCKLSQLKVPNRSTLYYWKHRLKYFGSYSLKNKSTRPEHVRVSLVTGQIVNEITKIRKEHPGYGKLKIQKYLHDIYTANTNNNTNTNTNTKNNTTIAKKYIPSVSTVGRIIKSLKQSHVIPTGKASYKVGLDGATGKLVLKNIRKKQFKQRRKGYKPKQPGDLIQLDTICYQFNGSKRYILTAIDVFTRYTWSYATTSHSSLEAERFLNKIQLFHTQTYNYKIKHIQTDNGSEFHKYFDLYCRTNHITHFYNYPRSPKMNAYIERFNRTIQDEYLSYHLFDLRDNIPLTNILLSQWNKWYNNARYHLSLDMMTPAQYTKQVVQEMSQKSKM